MTWKLVALCDLGKWYGGGTPSKSRPEFWAHGSIPWLSPKDMGPSVLQGTQDKITTNAIANSAAKLVPPSSVAVVTRSGILERTLPVALVPFETTLNQDMKALIPSDDIDPRWVAWGLRAFERELLRDTRKAGTTVASIEMPRFYEFKLPVPPLHEQQRIIDVLEDHLSRLDAAALATVRADTRAHLYLRASLAAGLRGTLVADDLSEGDAKALTRGAAFTPSGEDRGWTLPDGWAWARLGDLFEINVGSTPSRANPALWDGDLPWVSSGEVAFGRISSTRERITRGAAGNPATRIHPPGTVMLAMIGEGKTRGQAAILDVEAAHNQNCASIRVSQTDILPEYVYGYLEERYLETRRGGSGGQQPALNKKAIQHFPIPIAPLGTQRKLVEAWADARARATRLSGQLEVLRKRHILLRQALLAAAFSGQLTAGPADTERVEGLARV